MAIMYIVARKCRLVVIIVAIDSWFTTRFAIDDEAIRDIYAAWR